MGRYGFLFFLAAVTLALTAVGPLLPPPAPWPWWYGVWTAAVFSVGMFFVARRPPNG